MKNSVGDQWRLLIWSCLGGIALLSSASAVADQRIWNPFVTSAAVSTKAIESDEGATANRQLNWRRSTLGLPSLATHNQIVLAAERHSQYLSLNNITGHNEARGTPGFTGVSPGDRLTAAGYPWQTYGEVVSAGPGTGPLAVEALLEAIYHRFGMLRSDVTEVGSGFDKPHPTYGAVFTMKLGARQASDSQAGQSWLGTYPVAGQTQVPIDFYSDTESPDPVAGANRVGYPISVHAASSETLTLTSFTLATGGTTLPVTTLAPGADSFTPRYAAAIIPSSPLTPGQTYTADFKGTIGGRSVSRQWTFQTAPLAAIRTVPSNICYVVGSGGGLVTLLGGSGTYSRVGWSGSSISVSFVTSQQLRISTLGAGTSTITVTDSNNATAQFSVLVSAGACPAPLGSPQDRLFNWAEASFPRYFAPAGATTTTTSEGLAFRHYDTTHNYLGVLAGVVYFMDGFSGTLLPLGNLDSFLPLISQAGF